MPLAILRRFNGEIRRRAWLYAFIAIYIGVLLFRFQGLLFTNELLPGWDTVGHYLALNEYLPELASGHFFTYSSTWFGGSPLFLFYAPLSFLVMGGIALLTGPALPLLLIFRWFVFLTFAVFPIAFYFFTKEYYGARVARWGLWFSFFWVFFPKLPSSSGVGAAGAVFFGLFSQVLAVNFLLWYLMVLRRILKGQKFQFGLCVSGGAALALLVLAHTLTLVLAFIWTILFVLYHVRALFDRKRIAMLVAVAMIGALLSAFWLIPFALHQSFTSAERIDTVSYSRTPLSGLFPFDLGELVAGHFFTVDYGWLFLALLFFIGAWGLIRKHDAFLPFLVGVSFVILELDYLNAMFPDLTLHYYRFFSGEFAVLLAVAAWGLVRTYDVLAQRKKALGYVVLGVFLFGLVNLVGKYNLGAGSNDVPDKARVSGISEDIPYYWTFDQFKDFAPGMAIIKTLGGETALPEPVRRVLPTMVQSESGDLGSMHFFNSLLPLLNGQRSIFGLYAESAWQLPFIFPATNALTGDHMEWGKVSYLENNNYFEGQTPESMVDRLRLFGVNYFLSATPGFTLQSQAIPGTTLVQTYGTFALFWVKGSKPFVYTADHMPGLYLDADGSIPFRIFALGWYSEPDLLSYPVAGWPGATDALSADAARPFNFIIVGLSRPNPSLLQYLESFGKPILVLNTGTTPLGLGGAPSSTQEADGAELVSLSDGAGGVTQPNLNALSALDTFIHSNAVPNPVASTSVPIGEFSDHTVDFYSEGPTIVNLGYFPYWRRTDGGRVFPVTPGQMLVLSNGRTTLTYRAGMDATVGEWLSILTGAGIIGFLGFSVFRRTRRRRLSNPVS